MFLKFNKKKVQVLHLHDTFAHTSVFFKHAQIELVPLLNSPIYSREYYLFICIMIQMIPTFVGGRGA